MKLKAITRNNETLSINFCTTGNFKNLTKIKFIPSENSLKIKKPKKMNNKKSLSNLSEYQTIKREEITKKDELIKKLQERVIFLETKIKFLEKEKIKNKIRSRNESLNNTLILKTEKSFSYNKFNRTNHINKTNIPLDKFLLKDKLNKRKKNLLEIININKLINKKNKANSFYEQEKTFKNDKNKYNNSLTNYNSRNNSGTNSELKLKKRSIRLTNININTFHKSLYSMCSKSSKKIMSNSIEQKKNKNVKIKDKKILNKKINAIPKKGRINQNNTILKITMSSTNYSNNVSNSFKEDNMANKKINTISNNEIITNNNTSFNDIKIKLENIKNRTKKLLDLYSLINKDKANNNINNNKLKGTNYSNYIKIFKLEKIKK